MEIAIVGSGSWGTALANLLGEKGFKVHLWARSYSIVEEILKYRENKKYLPGVSLSNNIYPNNNLKETVRGKPVVMLAVPSHATADISLQIASFLSPKVVVVNVAKGLDEKTQKPLSKVISSNCALEMEKIAVLSGPNHAEEVSRHKPSASVVASLSRKTAQFVQDLFVTPYFRVYTNPDLTGVELGGALKNVIAIGAGVCDGLQLGDNAKAALMTRGLVEITKLGVCMGAKARTFSGLAGLGDLFVTCTSQHSRNRFVGYMLGKGNSLQNILKDMKMVAEGIKTTKTAIKLAKSYNIEMPITEQVYRLLFKNADPLDALQSLMKRDKTIEIEELAFYQ